MFVIEGQQTAAEIREQKEIDSIIGRLESKGYSAVLRSIARAASESASLESSSVPVSALLADRVAMRRWGPELVALGDLLFQAERAYFLQPLGPHLHAWEVRRHTVPTALAEFCSCVEEAAKVTLDGRRVRGMTFSWKPIRERQPRRYGPPTRFYKAEKLESKPADYTVAESEGARLLVCAQSRKLALRLAQLGKARLIDAAQQADENVTKPLLEGGLLRREYLVICKQDSHTIASVQERTEFSTGGGEKFSCTVCGRPFKDELVQEILALSDLGKKLLTGSRWLTILVTEILLSAGISKESIRWNPAAGEDELDIMTDALGPRVFFELKDREFGLGDAYPFAFRVSRYGGTFGAVVTTERVADEAKKFFEEQAPNMPARIEFIEGEGALESGVQELVDRFSRSGVMQVVADLTEPLAISVVPLLRRWMERQAHAVATSGPAPLPSDAA